MIKQFFGRVFSGFFLGVSVFAPGFSGSVIAIILGIYQDLLRIASNPFKNLKENIIFCIPLGIGAVISAVLFVISFKFLFDQYERATYMLFVGLIAGNLPMIYAEIKKNTFKKGYLTGGISAFVAALALGLLATSIAPATGADALTASLPMMAISGIVAGMMALVPGMSVSMVLIILGVYHQLIFIASSLLHMELQYLLPFMTFGVCAVAGIVAASKGIKAVFEKFPGFANTMVFGFMAGSLVGVLIESLKLADPNFTWLLGGIMLAAGLGVSMLFVVLGRMMHADGQ